MYAIRQLIECVVLGLTRSRKFPQQHLQLFFGVAGPATHSIVRHLVVVCPEVGLVNIPECLLRHHQQQVEALTIGDKGVDILGTLALVSEEYLPQRLKYIELVECRNEVAAGLGCMLVKHENHWLCKVTTAFRFSVGDGLLYPPRPQFHRVITIPHTGGSNQSAFLHHSSVICLVALGHAFGGQRRLLVQLELCTYDLTQELQQVHPVCLHLVSHQSTYSVADMPVNGLIVSVQCAVDRLNEVSDVVAYLVAAAILRLSQRERVVLWLPDLRGKRTEIYRRAVELLGVRQCFLSAHYLARR